MMTSQTWFITACPQKHLWTGQTLTVEEAEQKLANIDKQSINCIACDTETNGLDPIENAMLLYGAKIGNDSFIVDTTTVDPVELFNKFYDVKHIFHNAKFDNSFLEFNYNDSPKYIYDVMLANQKIYQNLEMSHSLMSMCLWWLNIHMNKEQRREFIGIMPHKFTATDDMINYLVGDLSYLEQIMILQETYLQKDNPTLLKWLYEVEFPLVNVLVEVENDGMKFDLQGLAITIKGFKQKAFDAAKRLDELVQEIGRDNLLVKGGKFTNERNNWQGGRQLDIFGNPVQEGYTLTPKTKRPVKLNQNTNNINWSSSDQIIEVFGRLNLPAPLKDEQGYAVPIILANGKVDKANANTVQGERIKIPGFTTDAKAWQKYLVDMEPELLVKEFIENLEVYNKNTHMVNSFGENYFDKVYEDGRIRTIFRQCATANGRLASGGGNNMPKRINAQNVPRDNSIRNLFIADVGNEIITTDLSGAEVTIICDKANDIKLYNWAVKQDDAHSPIITNSWRYIWLYRAAKAASLVADHREFMKRMRYGKNKLIGAIKAHNDGKVIDAFNKYLTFTVSKKENAAYRQGGKNNTFGSLYNMGAKKAAETYNGTDNELHKRGINERVNVTIDEAAVALWAIKQAIPVSFAFMEKQSATAFYNGSLLLSEVSGSRVWFDDVVRIRQAINKEGSTIVSIDVNKGIYTSSNDEEYVIDWKKCIDISGQARNLPISGTQADMVKKMMVELHKYFNQNNHPIKLRLQVHDELAYEAPIDYKINGELASQFIRKTMVTIANQFLNHFNMGAETNVGPCWSK